MLASLFRFFLVTVSPGDSFGALATLEIELFVWLDYLPFLGGDLVILVLF